MSTTTTLAQRFAEVNQTIRDAAARAGAPPGSVLLVAVTKYADMEQLRELVSLGHRDFGENRVQHLIQRAAMVDEWLTRQRSLQTLAQNTPRKPPPSSPSSHPPHSSSSPADAPVRWHLIGPLQRNKIRKAIDAARLIHSVSSLKVAEEIQAAAIKRDHTVEILLQVNVAGETSKSGCTPPAALPLAEQIDTMVNVRLRGLMTMAPYSENPEDSRSVFARTRELFHEVRDAGISHGRFDILSMGMSGDYRVAIEEGSNCVRVGSAIFGEPSPDALERDKLEDDDDN